jgi:hypothetical protein
MLTKRMPLDTLLAASADQARFVSSIPRTEKQLRCLTSGVGVRAICGANVSGCKWSMRVEFQSSLAKSSESPGLSCEHLEEPK